MKLVIEIENRITTEHQACTITELHGYLRGTRDLCSESLYAVLPEIIRAIPRCKKVVFESGCDIRFVSTESVIRKECPSENIYHTDQLENTDGLFGTFFC